MRITKKHSVIDEMLGLQRINRLTLPTTGWTAATTGSGATPTQTQNYIILTSTATVSSTALVHTLLHGFNPGAQSSRFNYNKPLSVAFNLTIAGDDTNLIRYVQIKNATTHGDLAAKGIGVKFQNRTIYGESYGTLHGTVELATVAVSALTRIGFILYPGVKIVWYVNGVAAGEQADTNKIPTALSGANTYFVASVDNGASAVACYMDIGGFALMQGVL